MNALAPEARLGLRAWPTRSSPRRAAGRPGKPVVCASGLSPSGPIHLGNLREVMIPHLVADEIRRRGGSSADHLISWDDYDRFRRVPAGIDPSWAEHIGKPLTAVPAPPGSPHANWADHFGRRWSTRWPSSASTSAGSARRRSTPPGRTASRSSSPMRERARHRRGPGALPHPADGRGAAAPGPELDEQEAAGRRGVPRAPARPSEDDGAARPRGYYPYKPYCTDCGTRHDHGHGVRRRHDRADLRLPAAGYTETVLPREFRRGQAGLEGRLADALGRTRASIFEPSGVDHRRPARRSSSAASWSRRSSAATQPIGPMYAFVGIKGMAKMSSSRGGVPTPADALEIMEAGAGPLALRAPQAEPSPSTSPSTARSHRMYDEWDSLSRKVADGTAQAADLAAHARATAHRGRRRCRRTPRPLPYRTLASVVDITTGARRADAADPVRPRPGAARSTRWTSCGPG